MNPVDFDLYDVARQFVLDRYGAIPHDDLEAKDRWMTRFGMAVDLLTYHRDKEWLKPTCPATINPTT